VYVVDASLWDLGRRAFFAAPFGPRLRGKAQGLERVLPHRWLGMETSLAAFPVASQNRRVSPLTLWALTGFAFSNPACLDEKNERTKESIRKKFKMYLDRAEQLKQALGGQKVQDAPSGTARY
jgi:hypothetical protein